MLGSPATAKKTVNVGDVASDPNYLTALSTTRSEIIVPVLDITNGCVVGTIDVESEPAQREFLCYGMPSR